MDFLEPDERFKNAPINGFRTFPLDRQVLHIPVTDKDELVLWKCRPECGKCCFPRALSVLPKDMGALKEAGAVEKPVGPTMMPQIEVEPFQRCRFLDDERRCKVYDHRPHSCHLYPFQPDGYGNVAYLPQALRECPGFYLSKDVDEETKRTWTALAADVAEGLAVMHDSVRSEALRLMTELQSKASDGSTDTS